MPLAFTSFTALFVSGVNLNTSLIRIKRLMVEKSCGRQTYTFCEVVHGKAQQRPVGRHIAGASSRIRALLDFALR
jgi:hypothetical protein